MVDDWPEPDELVVEVVPDDVVLGELDVVDPEPDDPELDDPESDDPEDELEPADEAGVPLDEDEPVEVWCGTDWQDSGSTYWLLLAEPPGHDATAVAGPNASSPASTANTERMERHESTLATVCQGMKLLAFSDLHRDRGRAERLVELARQADVVIGAGDFASMHIGLGRMIETLSAISTPTLLVPGNNETDTQLLRSCADWHSATVLHGTGMEIDGVRFFGLGGGVPKTPFPWSFDLDEDEASAKLASCPEEAVLIVHSPPKGYVDRAFGRNLGSEAILETIERTRPPLALCGHIHQAWNEEAQIGDTRVVNVGPDGMFFEV